MAQKRKSDYAIDVFINCPFDSQYKPLRYAIIFSIFYCGFRARCTLEISDASRVRIETIFKIISECKYGLHDISRTSLDPKINLPRFNMPFELGVFLGAKRFGTGKQKQKVCLIIDIEQYRYREFLSDIAGHDIQAHGGEEKKLIKIVRDWLSDASRRKTVPGGAEIYREYKSFLHDLPKMCEKLKREIKELTFNDYANTASEWIQARKKKVIQNG